MIARLSATAAVLGHNDLARAAGAHGPALRGVRGPCERPRRAAALARSERLCDSGPRAAAFAPPRCRRIRLSSRRHRPSPERRRARAHRRGTPRTRRFARLCRARRSLNASNGCSLRSAASRRSSAHQTSYSDETNRELAIVHAAAEAHRLYGAASVPNYVISKTDAVSDILEVALLLKEAWLLRPGARARREHRSAVRDDRRPAQLPAHHGSRFSASPNTSRC